MVTVQDLAIRCTRLERACRRLQLTLGVLVLPASALLIMGQASSARAPSTVEGQEFRLLDGEGRLRARIGTDPSGHAVSLTLLDARNVGRLELRVTDDRRGAFGQSESDVILYDRRGRPRYELTVGELTEIGLKDEEGRLVYHLISQDDGARAFSFRDRDGVGRIYMGVDDANQPALLFKDEEDEVKWKAP